MTKQIHISLHNQWLTLPENTTLAGLIASEAPEVPFAVAVNTVFVPKAAYADMVLSEGDCVDIVRPVAGG